MKTKQSSSIPAMYLATERYFRAKGRLIDISGLIGCIGAALLQWGIAFGLLGEQLFGQIWTLLSWFAQFLAKSAIATGSGVDTSARLWTHIYFPLWSLAVAIFAAIYWRLICSRAPLRPEVTFRLLATQLAIVLVAGDVLPKIFAMELPLLLPFRRGLRWLLASWGLAALASLHSLAYFPNGFGYAELVRIYVDFVTAAALDITFFAFGLLAAREKRGRHELELAHAKLGSTYAELLAAQILLASRVRTAERVRIAQEVHATIDQKLSLQNAQLEEALDKADATCFLPTRTAKELSIELLQEVRKLVDAEPNDPPIDLRDVLTTLCSGIPHPKITLSYQDSLEITTPATANAIFRCMQEAISNAVRHARARTLTISLTGNDNGIRIAIDDDGIGTDAVSSGSGLSGMRERVEALGGRMHAGNRPGGGFGLGIWLPFTPPADGIPPRGAEPMQHASAR